MAFPLSYLRDPVSPRDLSVGTLLAAAPQVLTGDDVSLRPFCSDTNQEGIGACAGNATADSVEILINIEAHDAAVKEGRQPPEPIQLSRLFVYALARTLDGTLAKDEGTYVRSCFEVLSRFGICLEADWAYDTSKVYVSPSLLAQRKALGHKIHSYYRVKSTGAERLDEVVAALRARKPVVFGTLVEEAFRGYRGGEAILPPKGATIGGHAMVIVGYVGGKFLVKNSWGPDWGDGGYALFSPEYIAWDETWDLWVPTMGTEFGS